MEGVESSEVAGKKSDRRSFDYAPLRMKMAAGEIVLSHPSRAWMGHPFFVQFLEFSGLILRRRFAPLRMTNPVR
jgi:hypothetical protein